MTPPVGDAGYGRRQWHDKAALLELMMEVAWHLEGQKALLSRPDLGALNASSPG